MVLEKTLESPLDCKEIKPVNHRENQSWIFLLEGLMLKLKLQYSGHLMQRADSLEKTWCWERLKAGREGDNRGQDGWMASLTQWMRVWASSRRWWSLACCSPWGHKESDITEQEWDLRKLRLVMSQNHVTTWSCVWPLKWKPFPWE